MICGYDGQPLKTMARTIELVNDTNRIELLKLITSKSPQSKIHGYVGLYFIQKNGVVLTEIERKKMKRVERMHSKVKFCEGCFFGLIDNLSNLISEEKLEIYYSWYYDTR
jgi:hypothetical protein